MGSIYILMGSVQVLIFGWSNLRLLHLLYIYSFDDIDSMTYMKES